jgi:hypothetical protein
VIKNGGPDFVPINDIAGTERVESGDNFPVVRPNLGQIGHLQFLSVNLIFWAP